LEKSAGKKKRAARICIAGNSGSISPPVGARRREAPIFTVDMGRALSFIQR
jgi:hypothetical protein